MTSPAVPEKIEVEGPTGVTRLRELLTADVARFDKESKRHKAIHRRAELLVMLLTALTTIVAGFGLLRESYVREVQFAVLVLSAVATAITSWAASRRARELWQHEREVFYALTDTLRELDFRSSVKKLELTEVEELFARCNAILGSSTTKWSRILEQKSPAAPAMSGVSPSET